jgi:hypothetical protein
MEKIIGVLQRLLKNILNYNMDKSEKSFYVIIENKKRGKFSGTSPIQVAKKVASKKLKSGKEIEFYLDEVGGKKKRYGPYQARKDKKTGRVSVVKGKKVMKGGLLSESDMEKLREFFYNYNDSLINIGGFKQEKDIPYFVELKLPWKSFFNEPIIFFDPSRQTDHIKKYFYRYAVFKESNGSIYIIKYEQDINFFKIINFIDFFLNPEYSINFKDVGTIGTNLLVKEQILEKLKNRENINSRTIREEARKIYDMLFVPTNNPTTQKVIIYVPNYSKPLIRKCVYSDLTFGIEDRENIAVIPMNQVPIQIKLTNIYQKFLIMKQSLIGGLSEPVIYIRIPSQRPEELYFKYCIYTESLTKRNLKITELNNNHFIQTFDFNSDFLSIRVLKVNKDIIDICSILLGIPVKFGELQRIREVSNLILELKNKSIQLPIQLNSLTKNYSNKLTQTELENQIKQIQQIIKSLKSLEPQRPELESNLNKFGRKFNQQNQLKSQLDNLQSLINQLQPQSQPQSQSQPQQTLEQQLSRLQKLLTDKLIEPQKLKTFGINDIPTIQPFQNQLQQQLKRNELTKLQQQILQRPESPQQQRIEYLQNKQQQQQQQQPIFSNAEYSKQRQKELNLFRQQNNREKSLIKQLQKLPEYSNAEYSKQRQRELNLIKQPEMSLEKPKTLYKQQYILPGIQENNK